MLLFQFVELSYHCFIQNYMEEVLTHQSSLDRVNERAQALLQTNADAKTSHAITQLTTRYHSVIDQRIHPPRLLPTSRHVQYD